MENTQTKKTIIIAFIKAAILATIVALALILIFAFILKLTNISDAAITPINMVIKAISVIVGTLLLCKNGQGGLVKGLFLGLIFACLSFTIFSILNGSFVFKFSLVIDLIYCTLVGAIVGVVAVNLKKS